MSVANLLLVPVIILVAWVAWLIFCAHLAQKHPDHAAGITEAAGVAFPFQRRRRHRKCGCRSNG